jgi:hypothetical protein
VSVEVKLSPSASTCYNYIDSGGGEKKVSVVIVPIGVEKRGEKIVVSWACSRGLSCHNRECRYSFLAKVPVAGERAG